MISLHVCGDHVYCLRRSVCAAQVAVPVNCSYVLPACTACVQDGHEVVQQVVGYKKKPLEAAVEQLAGMAK